MAQDNLIELTAEIVSSHVANNTVAVGDVGNLVQRVYDALAGLGGPPEVKQQPKTPAVSVRSSVKPDYVVCLECGKQKTLKRHLATAHDMSPQQYRAEYGLTDSYPMVAPHYAEHRRALAKSIGLGRKRGSAEPAATEGAATPEQPGRPKWQRAPGRLPRQSGGADSERIWGMR